jgi:hypothetical protein
MPAPSHALIAASIVEYFSPSTKQRLLMLGESFAAAATCARQAEHSRRSIAIVRSHIRQE